MRGESAWRRPWVMGKSDAPSASSREEMGGCLRIGEDLVGRVRHVGRLIRHAAQQWFALSILAVSVAAFLLWLFVIGRYDSRTLPAKIEGALTVAGAVAGILAVVLPLLPGKRVIRIRGLFRQESPLNAAIFSPLEAQLGKSDDYRFEAVSVQGGSLEEQHGRLVEAIEQSAADDRLDLLVLRTIFKDSALNSALLQFFQSGKHVVFVDSLVELPTDLRRYSKQCCFVSSDNVTGGKMLASYVKTDFLAFQQNHPQAKSHCIFVFGPEVIDLGTRRSQAFCLGIAANSGNTNGNAHSSNVVIQSWDRNHVATSLIQRFRSDMAHHLIDSQTCVYIFAGADAIIPSLAKEISSIPATQYAAVRLLGYDGLRTKDDDYLAFDNPFAGATIDIDVEQYVRTLVSIVQTFAKTHAFSQTNYGGGCRLAVPPRTMAGPSGKGVAHVAVKKPSKPVHSS